MNRLVLAALALVAVGGGAYYFVMTRPAVGPGEGAPPLPATGVVEPSAVSTPRAELVDHKLEDVVLAILGKPITCLIEYVGIGPITGNAWVRVPH